MELYTKTTQEDLREFVFLTFGKTDLPRKRDTRTRLAFSGFFAAVYLVLLWVRPQQGRALRYMGLGIAIGGLILVLSPLVTRLLMERRYAGNEAYQKYAAVRVDVNGLTSMPEGGEPVHYSWDRVEQLLVSDRLYLFLLKSGEGLFFNREAALEQEEQLEQMIAEHLQPEQVVHRAV